MILRNMFIGALTLVASPLALSAQDYTLEQCIETAIRNNPSYQTRLVQIERNKLQVEQRRNAFLPSAQAGLGQSWDFGRSVDKTGVMSDRSSMATSMSIGASYELFTGFSRLHELKASKLQLEAATHGLSQARRDLGMQVVQAFYAHLHAKRVQEIAREQLAHSRAQTEYTEAMVQSGKWSRDKLAESQAYEAQDAQNLTQAENSVETTLLDLKQLMQVTDLRLVEPNKNEALQKAEAIMLSGEDYVRRVLEATPALKSNHYNILAGEEQLKSSRAGYMPSLSLSVGYGNSYYKVLGDAYAMLNLPFKDQIKQNGRSYIGLNLSIPIFDAFRTRSQIRLAKLNLRELEINKLVLETQTRKEVEMAQLATRLAQRKISAAEANKKASLAAEEMAEGKWKAGRTTTLELGQIRNKTFVATLEHLNAEYDFLLKAELLRYYLSPKP